MKRAEECAAHATGRIQELDAAIQLLQKLRQEYERIKSDAYAEIDARHNAKLIR